MDSLDFSVSAKNVFKYALPTILSGVVMNIYSMLDSLFVARFIDTNALSAVNIVGPYLAVALAVGTMVGVGGNALVSKQLGEGKGDEARQNFSFLVLFCIIVSAVFCFGGILLREPVLRLMGADDVLMPLCEAYAVPLFAALPFAMAGILFQMFFVAAGNPTLSFILSFVGGGLNIFFNFFFLHVMKTGVEGAGYGTVIGYFVQAAAGGLYFLFKRDGMLYFVKPVWRGKALWQACSNGASEMVGMLAVSVTMVAMNVILMDIAGADGVAAAAVVLAAQSVLSAVYMSYLEGTSALISYNYGKGDEDNLKKLYKINLKLIAIMSAATFAATFFLARPIALLYAKDAEHVVDLAVRGTYMFAPAFLLMGFNLFASSMYTAFNDGKTSAFLAFCRTLVFLIIPLMILPKIIGIDWVWLAMPAAEIIAVFMSVYFFKKGKAKYHYA